MSSPISIGDFRSDTVTVPTQAMLEAQLKAPVGDDVYGEDPSIHTLEETIARMCGKEAAVFCPTGTMTNQIGMRLHLQPLNAALCDARCHIFNYESGGVAYHSQAQLYPIKPRNAHHLTVQDIKDNFEDTDGLHKPHMTLIALENTIGGLLVPVEDIKEIYEFAKEKGMKMHLDGARLWNATVKSGLTLQDYCQYFDTVSLCFSKGLGAPIGSCLVGSAADIKRARHFRKLLGGGWRQAGGLAAAALYAVENHWNLLAQDHENAQTLFKLLNEAGYSCEVPETNMVWVNVNDRERDWPAILKDLKDNGILLGGPRHGQLRVVCHIQISAEHVTRLASLLAKHF